MKMYQRDKILNVSSESAWQALKEMNKWLPDLSTNSGISYSMYTDFFEIGRKYNITSKEGVVMDCELYSIDEENMTVEIHAEHKPLKSILICKVLDLGDNRTQIIRRQGYPFRRVSLFVFYKNKFFAKIKGETTDFSIEKRSFSLLIRTIMVLYRYNIRINTENLNFIELYRSSCEICFTRSRR